MMNIRLFKIIIVFVAFLLPLMSVLFWDIPSRWDMLGHLKYAQNIVDHDRIITVGIYSDTYNIRCLGHLLLASLSIFSNFPLFVAAKVYYMFCLMFSFALGLALILHSRGNVYNYSLKIIYVLFFIAIFFNAALNGTRLVFPYLLLILYGLRRLFDKVNNRKVIAILVLSTFGLSLTHLASEYFFIDVFLVTLLILIVYAMFNSRIRKDIRFLINIIILLLMISFIVEFFHGGVNFVTTIVSRMINVFIEPESTIAITKYYGSFFELDYIGKIQVIISVIGKDLVVIIFALLTMFYLLKSKNINIFLKIVAIVWILMSIILYFAVGAISNIKSRFLLYTTSALIISVDFVIPKLYKYFVTENKYHRVLMFFILLILVFIANVGTNGINLQFFIPKVHYDNAYVYVVLIDNHISNEEITFIGRIVHLLSHECVYRTNYPYILFYALNPIMHSKVKWLPRQLNRIDENNLILLIKPPYITVHYINILKLLKSTFNSKLFGSDKIDIYCHS